MAHKVTPELCRKHIIIEKQSQLKVLTVEQ